MRIQIKEYKTDENIIDKIMNMSKEELINEINDIDKLQVIFNKSILKVKLYIGGNEIEKGDGKIVITIYNTELIDNSYYLIITPIISMSTSVVLKVNDDKRLQILNAVEKRIIKMLDKDIIDMINDVTIRLGFKDVIKY